MENYFLKMIQNARTNEDVILYGNILNISNEDYNKAVIYLEKEYNREALSYPFVCPPFDANAAMWGAKTFYLATQLWLYRENPVDDLKALLPAYNSEINAGAILSADLLLRFLPNVITQLKLVDITDDLILILEDFMKTWHYSGIPYLSSYDGLDFNIVQSDNCLKQLYVNRIIDFNKIEWTSCPELKETILSNLGIFGNKLWAAYKEHGTERDKATGIK